MNAKLEIIKLANDIITASSACADPDTPAMFGGDGSDCGTGDVN